MLSVLVDNSVLKTRGDRPSDKEGDKEGIEMYSFLDKSERDSKDSDIEPLYEGPKFLKRGKTLRYGLSALCLVIVVLGVLASVAVLCYKLATLKKQSEDDGTTNGDSSLPPLTTKTTCGYVHGTQEEDIFVFKGIPYAVPPKGKYRWKAPVPLEDKSGCWIDTYQATDFKTKCYQKNLYTDEILGAEDCLYVNVWTPSLDSSEALDVMVFIHGGGTETDQGHLYGSGLISGSGHEGGMMPDAELAKSANMVFVSFNYRLGPFGFLAVNATDHETKEAITGNYGFMDQALLLKWVKDNIHNFGGDPQKVTVFGLGGGATSIFALLSSEQSMGLFQKAWLASPSPSFDTSLEQAFEQNKDFIQDSGCGESSPEKLYSCLQAMDPDDVMGAVPIEEWANTHFRDLPTNNEKSIALAIVDGKFMKESIHVTWHSKEDPFKNISLLIGSSAQEVDDWLYQDQLSQWPWSTYNTYVQQRFSDFSYFDHLSVDVLRLYPQEHTPEYQLTSMISDIRQVCGVNFMANLMAEKWVAPIYRYINNFTLVAPDDDLSSSDLWHEDDGRGGGDEISPGFHYAYHGIDVRHFFAEHEEDASRDAAFFGMVRKVVFEFVRGGTITDWQPFPAATGLLSSHVTQVASPYHSESCDFWKKKMFIPQHAWMN